MLIAPSTKISFATLVVALHGGMHSKIPSRLMAQDSLVPPIA